MTLLLIASLVLAAPAPITEVTVFTDQARVVRRTTVALAGVQRLELATLPDFADVSSIRVEATGAEVRKVDLEPLPPEVLRTEDRQRLVEQLDHLDLELARATQERAAQLALRDAVLNLAPEGPEKAKLDGSGWLSSQRFVTDEAARLQRSVRAADEALAKLNGARPALAEHVRRGGHPEPRGGWRVIATLAGTGQATATCTYLTSHAQWTPSWDVQLQPDQRQVRLSLAALVSQSTTEDWTNAALSFSTAIPSRAVKAPEFATWRIGTRERFIPTPGTTSEPPPPPPSEQNSGEGSSVITGTVTDAASHEPVRDVVVTATSPALAGEEVVVNDAAALYRLAQLPAGTYTLRFEKEGFRTFTRPDITLRADRTIRVNVQLQPESMQSDTVTGAPPTVDVGSTSVGINVGKEFLNKLAFIEPNEHGVRSFESLADSAPEPDGAFSLAPPLAWRAPKYGPDAPATMGGGYDLAFGALQKETIPATGGARRVPLWSAQWPVAVERKVFPALSPNVFLVAELENPSQQVLPGGPAQLSVGADPAGHARLTLVSPGERFTLPLGIDRAITPVRTVQLLESTEGLIRKDEVGTYTVTIELANPHPTPIQVRVFDQYPLSTQKALEIELLDSKPTAQIDAKKGWLEWRASIPSGQKAQFTFRYTIKRPRGWQLSDSEQRP